jgi:hypothetical protein
MGIYPDCPVISRTVEVGGLTKSQLLQKLQQASIMLNVYGERLFAADQFTTSVAKYSLETVELTVMDLGFPDGADTARLFKRAGDLGLKLCPMELGPYLRLMYLDQPEVCEEDSQQHQAPSGSITIASKILSEDGELPKGLYLRRMDGVLWLRGYRADHLHVWNPDDRFIFVQK